MSVQCRGKSPCWRVRVAALLLTAFVAAPAFASGVQIRVDRLDADLPASEAMRILQDAHDNRVEAVTGTSITPSRDYAVWFRLSLDKDWDGPNRRVLSIADPDELQVRAFLPPDYVGTDRSIYDTSANAGFTRHDLVFMLARTMRAAQPVYLRVEAASAIPRSIAISDVIVARERDLARARLDVLFPAIQLAIILVLLAFFVALRERIYVYLVGQILFIVLYELYAFGIGFEFEPTRVLAMLGSRAWWLSAAISAVFAIEFARHYLALASISRGFDWLMAALRWPLLGIAVLAAAPALAPGLWLRDALAVTLIVLAGMLLAAGAIAWHRGRREGSLFVIAWAPGLMLVTLRALQLIASWPTPSWLEFALPAAFAFASVVLAFGLAKDLLSIRLERDLAHQAAERDPLTGVLNRLTILARLGSAFGAARSGHASLSVLFLDLDHFKQINDTHGHRAGDKCLRAVIGPIAGELRQDDLLGRYGGEEFLVLLRGIGLANARLIAERIRHRVEQMPMQIGGTRIALRLSVGVASLDPQVKSIEDLIERADAALYMAKRSGRNRVSTQADLAPSDVSILPVRNGQDRA